jgi:O-antigen ligase
VRSLRATPFAPDLAFLVLGAGLTLLAALWSTRAGAILSLGLLLGLLAFMALLVAFVTAPHIAVAFLIPYFALIPTLKIFVSSHLAPTKDLMIGAAALAAAINVVHRKRVHDAWRGDHPVIVMTLLLMGLYFLDIGGGLSGSDRFGLAWFHGVRIVWEPFLLLLFGLSAGDPRRTLRWAIVALIATAFGVALVGLAQQLLGAGRLVSYGYSYGVQVRTIGGHLRSFGTLDEAFDYATVLAFGLVGVLLWAKRGFVAITVGVVIAAGLATSYVRGAAISVVSLLALVLARKGYRATAVFLLGAAAASAIVFILAATRPTPGRIVQAGPSTYLTLNGRTRSWRAAVGAPRNWSFGRGVGLYGTAAERATHSFVAPGPQTHSPTGATDSGYLATLSDVGLVGLVLLLALFGRFLVVLRGALARGDELAWMGIGLVTVMLLDAALRSSLTGFPTADIALLLVGLSLAATSRGTGLSVSAPAPPRWRA